MSNKLEFRTGVGLRIAALCVLLAGAGCAASIAQDNVKQAGVVRKRAAFDLNCPEDKLQVVEVTTDSSGWVKTFGAVGCDQRVSYVRVEGMASTTWVMNNELSSQKK
jgi:hypothetical protein